MRSYLVVKKPFATLLAAVLLMFLLNPAHGGDEKIRWYKLYEGRKKARAERKPMVVDFSMPYNCHRCMAMEKNIYSNTLIIDKLNRDFVPVKIDLSEELDFQERGLGEEYDYKHDCLLLFLDYRGKVVKDASGQRLCFTEAVTPEQFLEYLETSRQKAMKQ